MPEPLLASPSFVLGQNAPPAPPATTAAETGTAANPGLIPTPPAISGLPGGAIGGGISVSLLFASMVVAFIAVKVYKSKVKDIMLGVCVGVLGAGGFVGAIAWMFIGIAVAIVRSIAAAFG